MISSSTLPLPPSPNPIPRSSTGLIPTLYLKALDRKSSPANWTKLAKPPPPERLPFRDGKFKSKERQNKNKVQRSFKSLGGAIRIPVIPKPDNHLNLSKPDFYSSSKFSSKKPAWDTTSTDESRYRLNSEEKLRWEKSKEVGLKSLKLIAEENKVTSMIKELQRKEKERLNIEHRKEEWRNRAREEVDKSKSSRKAIDFSGKEEEVTSESIGVILDDVDRKMSNLEIDLSRKAAFAYDSLNNSKSRGTQANDTFIVKPNSPLHHKVETDASIQTSFQLPCSTSCRSVDVQVSINLSSSDDSLQSINNRHANIDNSISDGGNANCVMTCDKLDSRDIINDVNDSIASSSHNSDIIHMMKTKRFLERAPTFGHGIDEAICKISIVKGDISDWVLPM